MDFNSLLSATQTWFSDHGWKILLIISVAYLVQKFGSKFFGRIITSGLESSGRFEDERDRKLRADTLTSLVNSITKALTWIVASVVILSELGIVAYLAPLFGSAVVISIVLGFGVQTFVKDFVSGMFIVADNQYRVGDFVAITTSAGGEVEGTVVRITLRTTVLRDLEGAIHFIPNGNIARAANQTLDYAKITVEFKLPLTADLDKAEAAIGELGIAMKKEAAWHKSLIQAPYYHGVLAFDNEHVTVEVRAKTVPAQQWKASSEIRKRLATLTSENGFFDTAPKGKKVVDKK